MQSPDSDDEEPWWARALRHESQSHYTLIEGARVHYRTWNSARATLPLLLLAHGYRGHSHWWDWIAPAFTDRFRVAALDFSGMGASGWRARYTGESFAQDLLGVLAALGASEAHVVGHSFGGASLLRACVIDSERARAVAAAAPRAIAQAIVVDSWLRFPARDAPPAPRKIGASRPYRSFAEVRARYRLIPAQPVVIAPLLEHIARHSIREIDGGWRWCFDPALPFAPSDTDSPVLLQRISTPVDVVHAARSAVVDAQRAADTAAALRHARGPVTVPEAYHHLMLDQPLAFIATLRALLAPQARAIIQ